MYYGIRVRGSQIKVAQEKGYVALDGSYRNYRPKSGYIHETIIYFPVTDEINTFAKARDLMCNEGFSLCWSTLDLIINDSIPDTIYYNIFK